ncbi:hypothetical protein Bhyg_11420 [Pseudolycoriella hygida]|uniref:Uncharacterized protein n=1 Tax=Pseudolycoriella hygida TaxID=35572 RepID=A0A9Q0S075_9DIPT|nr:hypothetical protein Bhyg_11420 [Pseudolycoriella hygida]
MNKPSECTGLFARASSPADRWNRESRLTTCGDPWLATPSPSHPPLLRFEGSNLRSAYANHLVPSATGNRGGATPPSKSQSSPNVESVTSAAVSKRAQRIASLGSVCGIFVNATSFMKPVTLSRRVRSLTACGGTVDGTLRAERFGESTADILLVCVWKLFVDRNKAAFIRIVRTDPTETISHEKFKIEAHQKRVYCSHEIEQAAGDEAFKKIQLSSA